MVVSPVLLKYTDHQPNRLGIGPAAAIRIDAPAISVTIPLCCVLATPAVQGTELLTNNVALESRLWLVIWRRVGHRQHVQGFLPNNFTSTVCRVRELSASTLPLLAATTSQAHRLACTPPVTICVNTKPRSTAGTHLLA
jgi:hypothetical protein